MAKTSQVKVSSARTSSARSRTSSSRNNCAAPSAVLARRTPARGSSRTEVVEDKGLYSNLRQAATALQRATSALRRAEPEPPKRRAASWPRSVWRSARRRL